MKWVRLENGDWQAKGKEGDFLAYKWGGVWKARYRSQDQKKLFFMPIRHFLSSLKTMCEENDYWERD